MSKRLTATVLAVLIGLALAPIGCQLGEWAKPAQVAQVPPDKLLDAANAAMGQKDYAEAMRDYRLAADAGDASAMNSTGWLYENGWGVDKDLAEAMVWYRKAADTGYAEAMNNVAWLYEHGMGVQQDYVQAM